MRLTEIDFDAAAPIDGYGPGFFRIGGQVHQGHALVLPSGTKPWAGLDDYDILAKTAGEIDVLFIGTGPEIRQIPADLRTRLEQANLGIELMATPTACRTYNVLLSEGRRIGAALLAL